jgi:hypothetical protein
MTPEEIIKNYSRGVMNAKDYDGNKLVVKQAFEAIHQYAKDFAKDMCDKQKIECYKAYNEAPAVVFEYQAITNAPYPKELL